MHNTFQKQACIKFKMDGLNCVQLGKRENHFHCICFGACIPFLLICFIELTYQLFVLLRAGMILQKAAVVESMPRGCAEQSRLGHPRANSQRHLGGTSWHMWVSIMFINLKMRKYYKNRRNRKPQTS